MMSKERSNVHRTDERKKERRRGEGTIKYYHIPTKRGREEERKEKKPMHIDKEKTKEEKIMQSI